MKKIVLVLALVLGFLAFGMFTVNAYGYNPFGIDRDEYQEDNDNYYYNHMGRNHMGYGYGYGGCFYEDIEDYDYEEVYSHLNEEEKAEIDLLYIEKLAEYDVDALTETELKNVIDTIKLELIEYIIENDMHHYW
ncbi:MAG: hypothetical protein K9L64_00550 [Candidatus Izimaplasma sp.]|nr:hypothetical protein [Candidatus Izimaplasma bacterium]